jgi:hypothetical protein
VLSSRRERGLDSLRVATWIAGCERCRSHLLSMCADAGFDPRIGYSSDDMVVMQAWVAAGLGVASQTGLSLRAHRIEGVVATELPGSERHIYAATYGEPPGDLVGGHLLRTAPPPGGHVPLLLDPGPNDLSQLGQPSPRTDYGLPDRRSCPGKRLLGPFGGEIVGVHSCSQAPR